MSLVQYLIVSDDEAGQRLDNYLLTRLKGAPKSLIYRVIRKGEVRVNKGRAKPERRLSEGDLIRIPPLKLADKKAPPKLGDSLKSLLEESTLHESEGLLVVNKPSGLAVHGGSGVSVGLIESMRQVYPHYKYLELVHRLDKETSGCVMIAKKRSMLRYLQSLLRERGAIQKSYFALVRGHWPKRKHVIDVPLRRDELCGGERIVRVAVDGKSARTEFSIVETYKDATLVLAKPITGRTHQIRVHAQYCQHPLVGDPKYGDDLYNKSMKVKGFSRLFLHACQLDIPLPDGEQLVVKAPLPDELQKPLLQLQTV